MSFHSAALAGLLLLAALLAYFCFLKHRRRQEIRFSEDLRVAAVDEALDTDRPFWHFLALAAFAVLMCEWWFYQRRPGGI